MKKIVLALGYIPKGKGGKQKSGLATGIFDLHDSVNQFNSEIEVIIAATDVHHKKIIIDNTTIIGWNTPILLKHVLMFPIRTLFFITKMIGLFKYHKVISPFSTLAKFIFLDYSIKLIKPDLIHFHGSTGALISSGLWNKKIKKILRLHGINGFNPNIPHFEVHRKIEKNITKLIFDKITFVTNGIREDWKEKYGEFNCEMVTILNGFNQNIFQLNKINTINEKKYDLITFSGISENKGQRRVIEALNNLKRQNLYLSYLIIGSSNKEYLNSIKKFSTDNDLNVTFINYLPQQELVNYLHQSRFFILPSITEGFGKVYIESIGAGVPIIIPKHLPLVKENGILNGTNSVFIHDYSVRSIEEGLKNLFSSEINYSENEVNSTIEALQWKEIAKQYNEVYKNIFKNYHFNENTK